MEIKVRAKTFNFNTVEYRDVNFMYRNPVHSPSRGM